jgi:hypothetical protein
MSRLEKFVLLYFSHILTTIPIPLVLLVLQVVTPLQALSAALLLAGFWTLVGAAMMVSRETRPMRRLYLVVGLALVAASVLPSLSLGGL